MLTRKSLLARIVEGGGLLTRRGPPMLAFTCGSEDTGIRERWAGGVTFDIPEERPVGERDGGDTGDSGTARGSISGSGSGCVAS